MVDLNADVERLVDERAQQAFAARCECSGGPTGGRAWQPRLLAVEFVENLIIALISRPMIRRRCSRTDPSMLRLDAGNVDDEPCVVDAAGGPSSRVPAHLEAGLTRNSQDLWMKIF